MKRSGSADLPLHYGAVPPWLAERMARLGLAITESILTEYGRPEVLRRLSDPFWFQSLGAVMGMDWHSSGITTSVLGALKKSINPLSKELGIYICGGKGKNSRQAPNELLAIGEQTGLNAQRSEEHTSESSHVEISYAVFCLKKKIKEITINNINKKYIRINSNDILKKLIMNYNI